MKTYILVSSVFLALCSYLRLWRTRNRWIRLLDFPILQLACWNSANLVVLAFHACGLDRRARLVIGGLLATGLGMQISRILRYTPLGPLQALAVGNDRNRRDDLSLLIANVLMTNRDADAFLRLVGEQRPDIILVNEPDPWWADRLACLDRDYPNNIKSPLDNTYGMMLFSRLPLHRRVIHHLIHDDVPSIRTLIELESGRRVDLFCVHPRPPSETDTDERDYEILKVARMMKESPYPGLVAGDLNDVAWSRTTRLFQKESRMLDPRAGRGFFNTFHARVPIWRYPLDHVFYSEEFALVELKRLAPGGSDHFPIYLKLNLGHPKAAGQEAPKVDRGDAKEVDEVLAQGA
jgi:endonuclease/exonuclease/phosphatase (EEP) superfamily protein YafD